MKLHLAYGAHLAAARVPAAARARRRFPVAPEGGPSITSSI
ncbi:hypothetical protein ACFQNE_05355 [Gordonia phosphorivorans]|uniref:Uncharacterized protein n=1 Tax=Gordonia phosphorivorans TaxID=1056982 RepID=A0ABV6H5B6_9ACTN